jgi:RimJ/RimL family protein N-acetyltransferase
MGASSSFPIHLRPIVPSDLPTLFQFELDPESNRLAATLPRSLATFNARWAEVFTDPTVVPRAVVEGSTMVGVICAFEQEGNDSIGYWIDRSHWGKGYATRAIALLLEEVATRPLFARVAAHNAASRRALERNGFVVTSRRHTPATERYTACERLTLTLG